MKRLKYLLFLTPFLIMAGCDDYYMICSLNPFYLEKNIVLLPEIEGEWLAKPYHSIHYSSNVSIWKTADSTLNWIVKRKLDGNKNPSNIYLVEMMRNKPDSLIFSFNMVVFKAKNEMYADFSIASNLATNNSRLTFENQYPVHTLAKIIICDGQIILSWLNDETMRAMIEEKRVRASYSWIKSANRFLLTGSSAQLSEMIERYCSEERFVDWEEQEAMMTLKRVN